MEDKKASKNFNVWQCPYCKRIIHNTEYQSFKCDIGCPRCGCPRCGCPLAKFKKRNIKDIP